MASATTPFISDNRHLLQTAVAVEREQMNRHAWNMCAMRTASFDSGPLLWLTKYTQTEDSHWLAKGTPPVAPFPKKACFVPIMEQLLSRPVPAIWKSREMMASWLICGYIAWMCSRNKSMLWVAQTGKEDKVSELIEYARILHNRQPDWMKRRNPIVVDNNLELKWKDGGRFIGVAKGEDQIRMYHPYGYFQDESAFLPEAEQSFNAVRPVAKQIILVSTDELGWYHNMMKSGQP